MQYGWHRDPFGLHEYRYFSQGDPTRLVRDGNRESYDDPPADGLGVLDAEAPGPVARGEGPRTPTPAPAPAATPAPTAEPSPAATRRPLRRGRRRLTVAMVGLAVLVLAVLVAASSGPGPSADSASGPTGSADAAVHLSTGDGSRSGVSGSGAPSTSAAGQVVDAVHRIGRPPPSTVSVVPLSETAEPPVTVAPGGHAAAGGEPTTLAVGSGPSTTSTAPTSGKTSTVTTAKSPSTTSTSKPTATTSTSKPPSTTSTSKPTATTPTSKPTATTPTSKPPSTTSTPPTPTANSNPSTGPWQLSPSPSLEWQWELGHPLSMTSNADLGLGDTTYTGAASGNPTVYDIDGFDNGAATVAALHAIGAHVICYIDVGTWEDWRPDAGEFPTALLGSSNGWPGEQWLNTNPSGPDYATLQAIMTARFQMCKNEGYDAVEPDNLDGSENSTGFPLTVAEGDRYAEWVADEVHALGMSVAQKNFEDQSSILEPYFDFVIEEQCFQFGDCADLAPYTAAGKAVLEVEYSDQGANPSSYCATAIADRFSSVEFDTALDGAVRVPCA